MDYVREDLKEKNIQKLPGLVKRPKNKQKDSLEESCESLIVGTADGREEKTQPKPFSFISTINFFQLSLINKVFYLYLLDAIDAINHIILIQRL